MSSGPLRDDVTEHKQLMRAALNRDVDKTLDLNRIHITRTLDKVAVALEVSNTQVNPRMMNRKTLK
jgi:DNA-binding GntR family transcriptional regulator